MVVTFTQAPKEECGHENICVNEVESDLYHEAGTRFRLEIGTVEIECQDCSAEATFEGTEMHTSDWSYTETCIECGDNDDCDCCECDACGETHDTMNWCDCGCCEIQSPNVYTDMSICKTCQSDINCLECIVDDDKVTLAAFERELCKDCYSDELKEESRPPEYKNQVAKIEMLEEMVKNLRISLVKEDE